MAELQMCRQVGEILRDVKTAPTNVLFTVVWVEFGKNKVPNYIQHVLWDWGCRLEVLRDCWFRSFCGLFLVLATPNSPCPTTPALAGDKMSWVELRDAKICEKKKGVEQLKTHLCITDTIMLHWVTGGFPQNVHSVVLMNIRHCYTSQGH